MFAEKKSFVPASAELLLWPPSWLFLDPQVGRDCFSAFNLRVSRILMRSQITYVDGGYLILNNYLHMGYEYCTYPHIKNSLLLLL